MHDEFLISDQFGLARINPAGRDQFERLLTESVPADGKDGRPSSFVQWKGSELCLDFGCPCGNLAHLCGDGGKFLYAIHCPECDRQWQLCPTLLIREIPADEDRDGAVQELEDW